MSILIKPVVTEKFNDQAETLNRYAFIVAKEANKEQIKRNVEAAYQVKVENVNTMRYGGKVKTKMTKMGVQKGKTNSYKKAVVTLAEGDSIDFYNA